jgi:tryptophan synthase alpha chain
VRCRTAVPLVFMTYYNPVLNYGPERFCRSCAQAGINGLIVPDLPPEEGAELEALTDRNGIDLVYLLAPTSTGERIAAVAERSRGFIYLASVTGVTGARETLPPDLEDFVGRVRKLAGQPLCVGFGVGTPEQAGTVAAFADGVIVGSRLIQIIEEDPSLGKLSELVAGMRRALDSIVEGVEAERDIMPG